MKVKSLSRVQLSATPRTAAYQAPPSMGFSRQTVLGTDNEMPNSPAFLDQALSKCFVSIYCTIGRMATHFSTPAWKIPWMEEAGRLQSIGSLRVGHDSVTSLSLFTFMHWRRKRQPTPVFLPKNPRDRGVWWAAVYGVAQSQTRLKRLSSSSSSSLFSKI